MALAKLYTVTDCNGQQWFIAAASFGEAERKFTEWEVITDEDNDSTEELIDGIMLAGDLILGGNRDESLGNYRDIGYREQSIHASDWTLSNQMSTTGTALITELLSSRKQWVATPELVAKMEALKAAIEKYEEIPF